ncbi:MAG: ATP-binding protein, partial [Micrococcales bacterium]|nr:ATP-binding protein [Micrococcales bacterium]
VWRALASVPEVRSDPDGWVLPALVAPSQAEMLPVASLVVADSPMWCQRTDLGALLPVPALADLLDLPLASELTDGVPDGPGDCEPVPPAVSALVADTTWYLHDDLTVDGQPVEWWVHDNDLHAVHLAGLAAALAQSAGRWSARWALETVLTDPTRAPEALLDTAFGDT